MVVLVSKRIQFKKCQTAHIIPDILERAVIYAPSGQRDEGRRSVAGACDNRDDGGAAKCLEGRRGESGEESGGQEARHRKYQKANKRLYNHQRAK